MAKANIHLVMRTFDVESPWDVGPTTLRVGFYVVPPHGVILVAPAACLDDHIRIDKDVIREAILAWFDRNFDISKIEVVAVDMFNPDVPYQDLN